MARENDSKSLERPLCKRKCVGEHTFVERILFRDDTEKIRVDKAFILVRGKG